MAINFTQMTTSEIRMWQIEDAEKWLRYMRQNNEGLILITNRHMITIVPSGDHSRFIVNLNDGLGEFYCSNARTARKIVDAVAADYRGLIESEEREYLYAVTSRLDGRPNFVDKIGSKCSDIIDRIFN